MPATYTIEIDEPQRVIILRALALLNAAVKIDNCFLLRNIPDSIDPVEDLEALLDMTRELPNVELLEPAIIHGFCR